MIDLQPIRQEFPLFVIDIGAKICPIKVIHVYMEYNSFVNIINM